MGRLFALAEQIQKLAYEAGFRISSSGKQTQSVKKAPKTKQNAM